MRKDVLYKKVKPSLQDHNSLQLVIFLDPCIKTLKGVMMK